jgi:hypothetical protein
MIMIMEAMPECAWLVVTVVWKVGNRVKIPIEGYNLAACIVTSDA